VLVTVLVSPVVINVPEVAGIVIAVVPAVAAGVRVTVPEVAPGNAIELIPVNAKLADVLFRVTAVVPTYSVEFPNTALGIVPVRLPAVRDEADVRYVFVSNANVPAAVIFTNEVDA